MSDAQKMTEREVAKRLLENVDNLTKSYEGLSEEIDSIRTNMKNIEGIESEGVNNADVLKEFEGLRATVEDMKDQAEKARSANGDGISGLKEEAHKFSLIRAMDAIHTNSWENAGFEREVMEQARTKAQAIGVGTAGGYFVPDEVLDDVIQAIYTRSALINLGDSGAANRISVIDGLQGGTVKVPKFLGGLVAYFIGEEDEYTESQTRVGDVVMTPKKLAVMVRLTQEMRNYAGFGFENLLREDMVRAAAKKLDNAILYGRGTADEPRGIINGVNATHLALGASELNANPSVQVYGAESGLASVNADGFWNGTAPAAGGSGAAGAALDFDDLDKMKALLEDIGVVPDESAAFLAHPKFFRKLRQLKIDNFSGQSSDQPYLLGMPMISDERLQEVIGPFVTSTQVEHARQPGANLNWGVNSSTPANTFGNVFYGNWNEVLLGRWGGIEIDDDAGRGKGFTRDHIYVKMRMYLDVGMRHDQSIVVCDDANYA
jgi:HK97 family phage major capsid protein